MHVAPVLHFLSLVIMLFAGCMLLPLAVSVGYVDAAQHAYFEAVPGTFACGAVMWAATRKRARELQARDGFLLVALVWTVLPAFAAWPLLRHLPGISFTDAYFEAVAGLTATGATVLSGLDALPPSINFWRCFLQWLAGMGVLVLAVAILPLLGVGGRQLLMAEFPGPMKDTKLTPRITETAKALWSVYVGLTVACGVAYRWAGMPWLDAVMHSLSTIGLGGFSSHDASLGHFQSGRVEAVAVVFMLVAGLNFATHFTALHQRSLVPYRRDPEAVPFLLVALLSAVLVALYLLDSGTYPDALTAFRFALFNVVSIATTTGYATADFAAWPFFAPLLMLFLCSFCSCSGSTGGGIKMVRAQVMFLQTIRELTRNVHPRAIVPLKLGGRTVDNNIVFAVLAFMLVYGGAITAMTMVLVLSGVDFMTAYSAVVACINNTGPGLNLVGPGRGFQVLSDFQTWVCCFAMLLGRLELFTLLVVMTPAFWRK
jgi:trk system potassium uptake protein TrkH